MTTLPAPSPVRLFSSDLDGTLLGNPESTQRFKAAWNALPTETRPLLVYNSGRPVADLERLVNDGTLPYADFHIGGVGTQIFDVRARRLLDEFHEPLADGWNRSVVDAAVAKIPGIRAQSQEFQHEFKSSWLLEQMSPAALLGLKQQLAAAGLKISIVYSSSRDLDILPLNATKSGALSWLCRRLRVPLKTVLVAGDTGNDTSMFRLRGVRGIIVRNAQPELLEETASLAIFRSRFNAADGVLDGLRHFGMIDPVDAHPRDRFNGSGSRS